MRGFNRERGGGPQGAKEVGGPAPSTRREEASEGDPDAVGETVGEGAAEKYASGVEEEKSSPPLAASVRWSVLAVGFGRPE